MPLQALLRVIYPSSCIACDASVTTDFGLCPSCWLDTPFIGGLCCDACGCGLPGQPEPNLRHLCDDCLPRPPPWDQGRAVMRYDGTAKRLVMSFKHADRLDLVRPFGTWMARAAAPLLQKDTILAPIPLHWLRLLKRKSNQAALLASQVAKITGHRHIPDLLLRPRATQSLDHMSPTSRRATLSGAFAVHPRYIKKAEGRPVLLVDDVMTTGTTLTAATHCLMAAGVSQVSVLTLCRTTRDN